jgi:hypothetical protein
VYLCVRDQKRESVRVCACANLAPRTHSKFGRIRGSKSAYYGDTEVK